MGNIVWGIATLISVGLNGLALWFVKDYKAMLDEHAELHEASLQQEKEIEELTTTVIALRKKVTPWNKGKTGYKHQPRAKKSITTVGEYAEYPGISELMSSESEALFTPRID